jgi:regulator of RNase E activity RraA
VDTATATLGILPPAAFGALRPPRLTAETVHAFHGIGDLTGTISDAMDELGIAGAIAASHLKPSDPRARIVGRAITVRNVRRDDTPTEAVKAGTSFLADVEAHNLAEPGDVLVLEGIDGVSNMGSILASIARRAGEIGAIVDGSVRDIEHSRSIGYPVWSRSVSPITGKWRLRTVEVNKPVRICGITVEAGDLVAADEVGVCVVPHTRIEEVLLRCRRITEREASRREAIAAGSPISDVMSRPR